MIRSICASILSLVAASLWTTAQAQTFDPGCEWVAVGGDPRLTAEMCTSSEQACALALNSCLQDFDFETSENWWLFTADNGLQAKAPNPVHINHQTPQHGLFLSVYVNKIAYDALSPLLAQTPAPDKVSLPGGSVIAKVNYNSIEEFDNRDAERKAKKRWLTAMAKVSDFCQPNKGGTCNGGNWFYYLSRFGQFLSFVDVYGVMPNGDPLDSGRENSYGKPSAFCTDCHNPVEKTDFLWTLDAAFWKTETPLISMTLPRTDYRPITPADLCEAGTFVIESTLPADVPTDPATLEPGAAQAMFDCFSWKSFIALNWPADPAMRGQPDNSLPFPSYGSERAWESYKETFEVFQPGIVGWTVRPEQWNETAVLPDACQAVVSGLSEAERAELSVPKPLQMVSKTRANQVLNETHQAFGNQFNVLIDQKGRLVRYEVRFNRDEFDYLAANQFADTGNFSYSGPLSGEKVFFPTNADGVTGAGSIEIKAAWRELNPATDDTSRYYTRKALKFTPPIGDAASTCAVLPAVGLIGLHLIRKTETAPQWVWATFEHIDNVPPAGEPGETGVNYTLYNDQCASPENKPTGAQCAGQRPGVLPSFMRPDFPSNQAHCCANLQLLENAGPGKVQSLVTSAPASARLISNQVTRLDPIGPNQMNGVVVDAIAAAFQAQGMKGPNPFINYRLVNTQWPEGARDPDGSIRRLSCFQTGLLGRADAPCYTILPRLENGKSLRLRNTSMETFQVSTDGPGADDPTHFSSAGCLNCHGDAGVDFSFVFTDGEEISSPVQE